MGMGNGADDALAAGLLREGGGRQLNTWPQEFGSVGGLGRARAASSVWHALDPMRSAFALASAM